MFPPHLIWDPTNLGNINLNINIILGGVSHNSPNSLRALRRTRLVGTARWRFVRSHGMLHLYIYIYSTYWHGLQPSLAQILGGFQLESAGPGEDLWGRRQRHPFASFWWGWTGPMEVDELPDGGWGGGVEVVGTQGFPRKQRETSRKISKGMETGDVVVSKKVLKWENWFVGVFFGVFSFVELILADKKRPKEICGSMLWAKKGGDPSTSKLNLDYLALLMAENLYRNMYSLFIPWQRCIYRYIDGVSPFHPCVGWTNWSYHDTFSDRFSIKPLPSDRWQFRRSSSSTSNSQCVQYTISALIKDVQYITSH